MTFLMAASVVLTYSGMSLAVGQEASKSPASPPPLAQLK